MNLQGGHKTFYSMALGNTKGALESQDKFRMTSVSLAVRLSPARPGLQVKTQQRQSWI